VSAAAKILGEHLADQFLLTHVAKAAVATVEGQISSWKNAEVEAAYQAFKNGATSTVPWWGYQVEKGNFEDVWTQMGGVARQLELEAIRAQEKVRKDAGMPPLTVAEQDKLRAAVQRDLEQQFTDRVTADAEIAKEAAELALVMKMYKDAGFLEKGDWGNDKGLELPQRLDILAHFKDKLEAARANWEMDIYGGARHGFTNPDAAAFGMENLSYNAQADARSWQRMQAFFNEIFAE